MASAYESFGFDLLAQLMAETAGGNVLFSPLSIAVAIAMIYNGAHAETSQVLAKALGLTDVPLAQVNDTNKALLRLLETQGDKVQLTLANSVWTRKGLTLDDDFVSTLETAYASEVEAFDPVANGAADMVNHWVSSKTQGKITALVSDGMLRAAIVVVLNAIYFKGLWAAPFQPRRTKEQYFMLADGTTKLHPMMSRTGRYRYSETDLFQAVCLPYANEQTSLYVFLPRESVSLLSFCSQLTAENWRTWLSHFRSGDVTLTLPRFKAQYDCRLKESLTALGLGNAFSSEANFSGMGAGNLTISDVIHKAVIELNEQGSEAVAATAVMMVRSTPRQVSVNVNRPFFYAIRDDSLDVVLFMGCVVDPAL